MDTNKDKIANIKVNNQSINKLKNGKRAMKASTNLIEMMPSEICLVIVFSISVFLINLMPEWATFIKYFIVLPTIISLFRYDSFELLLYPLLFLDDSIGTFIGGRLTLFWLYIMLLIIKLLYRTRSHLSIKAIDIFILLFASVFVAFGVSTHGMLYIKIIIVACLTPYYSYKLFANRYFAYRIQLMFIFTSLVTAVSLLFGLGSIISNFNREIGFGFSDPNYSAVVCCIGLCCSFNVRQDTQLKKIIFILIDIIFCLAIVATVSLTGITICILLISFKILASKGLMRKEKIIVLTVCLFLIIVFVIMPNLDRTYFESFSTRINNIFSSGAMTNFNYLTSGRYNIAAQYLHYLVSQDIIKIMFGFNTLNCPDMFAKIGIMNVTHSVYLDLLMAFGIIGSTVLIAIGLKKTFFYATQWKESHENIYLTILMIKLTMWGFGFSLAYLESPFWWFLFIL